MSHINRRATCTPPGRSASRGFTLIELMITVTVGIVLLGLAIPSFQVVFNSSRINTQANEFVATLQIARAEAIRRNARVVVCPSTNGTSCLTGNPTGWTGWLAFVDDGGFSQSFASGNAAKANNGVVDPNETILRTGLVNTPITVTTSPGIGGNTGGAIIFRSDGLARTSAGALLNGAMSVCVATTHPSSNERNVTILTGGRITVVPANGAGACPAPVDPTS